jgi:hypothetical protein
MPSAVTLAHMSPGLVKGGERGLFLGQCGTA